MKKRIFLYIFLVLALVIQINLVRYDWFPDLMVLIVVFSGIFIGGVESAGLGLTAGFLRGAFSLDTMAVDVFSFCFAGVIASILSRQFYRQNPLAQVFVTMTSMLFIIITQTLYLNWVNANEIAVYQVLANSWKVLAVTVLASPLLFAGMKIVLKIDE